VLIPTPYWVSYPEQVKLAGATPVYLTTDEKTGFKVTPQQLEGAITPRTKVFLLNSPSNPSGAVYTREELEGLAEVCVKHGLYVISDEIYEKLVYDGQKHISIASLGPEIKRLTVVINGMSKAYAMTGWRMGYAAAEPEIIKAMTAVQGHSTSNPTSIVQKASVAALEGPQEPVFKMVAEYNKRRDYVVERLNRLRGFLTPVPPGAFYVFPNVAELFGQKVGDTVIRDGDHLAEVLLNEAGVAVVPGSAFGAPANLRFSYATSMERIKEGLDRLERLLNG
jgi:aspartate aminotransferase